MFKVIILPLIFAAVAAKQQNDAASNQLKAYKEKTTDPGTLTTNAGSLVDSVSAASTYKNNELLTNQYFVENLAHFDRETIPERVAHAQGTGAFGYFEVTNDISSYCKAKLFCEVGKQTPVAVRFSTTASSIGASEFARETRGFAVKFYTEEGNYDFVGVDGPIFSAKDPLLTATLVHMAKRNPVTNLPDPNMFWDFASLHPEALFRGLYTLSDYGMPNGYRHMSGHAVHTFELYNENGTKTFARMHMFPDLGKTTLNSSQIKTLSSSDPNYFTRDLYNAIAAGDYPTWQFQMQFLTQDDVDSAEFDVFDATNTLPWDDYPLTTVGTLVLNSNPVNHFAQVEQMAFCPGNLIPGMLGSPDKLFAGRSFAYRDAQVYRLGVNFDQIPVNCPMNSKARNYNRDGSPPVGDNGLDAPWYYPNSFNGPEANEESNRPFLSVITETDPDNLGQAGDFYANLTAAQQNTVYTNIIGSLCNCENFIQNNIITYLKVINSDLGTDVETYMLANCQAY